MSISPINFNGMIQNTAEIGNLKSHEDSRVEVNQANIQNVITQEEERESHSVNELEEKTTQYDLGDGQGNNSYQGSKKKKKKKKDNSNADGVVIKKDSHNSFDMTI